MTQLLLFDAPESSLAFASPVYPDGPVYPRAVAEPPAADRGRSGAASQPAPPAITASTPLPQLQGSLPLYDPQRGELHRFGDLAQRVISRYEIVAQRRAILLARGPRQAARA